MATRSFADIERIVERYDAATTELDAAVTGRIADSLDASYRNLERELRRLYPTWQSDGSLYAVQRRLLLMEQLGSVLEVVRPELKGEYEALLQEALTISHTSGATMADELVRARDPGYPLQEFTTVPVEAVAAQARDGVRRLYRYNDDFKTAVSGVVEQGLIQGWGAEKVARMLRGNEQMQGQFGLAQFKSKAETIARTEIMSAFNTASQERYERNGIKYVQLMATPSERLCSICLARHGNVYRMGTVTAAGDDAPPRLFQAVARAPQGTVQAEPISLKAAQAEAKRLANGDYDQRRNAENIVLAAKTVEAGRKFVGKDAIAALSGGGNSAATAKLRAEVARREAAYDKAFASAADPFSTPEWKAYIKASNALKAWESDSSLDSQMAGVRDKLLGRMSQAEAAERAGQVKILKSAANRYGEEELRSQLTEFYQLTGGKGRLDSIKVTEARAWADTNSAAINLGRNSPAENKTTLYHEAGHLIEAWDNVDTLRAMQGFRAARATGAPAPLGGQYGADELAHPGRYIDPYVGKTYKDGATEVLAMGLQHFTSPKAMADLYRQDPEYFFLIVGALQ